MPFIFRNDDNMLLSLHLLFVLGLRFCSNKKTLKMKIKGDANATDAFMGLKKILKHRDKRTKTLMQLMLPWV